MLESDVHARRVLAQDRRAGLSYAARPVDPTGGGLAAARPHRRRGRRYLRLFRLQPRTVVDGP